MSKAKIPITITLRAEARNLGDISRVQEIAGALGLEPVSSGRASLTFRITEAKCRALFGAVPQRVPPQRPGARDYGTPGGFEGTELPVPAALQQYVESVVVVPPATRLNCSLESVD